jgi:Uma2 family endonuclease
MSEPAKKKATYDELCGAPDNMVAEIVDGELILTPMPARKHGYATTTLIGEILPPYHRGRGGPGGWIFIAEPEIMLGEDIFVPDIAGWRAERFIWEEGQNPVSVTPGWICEVLSQSTFRLDRVKKMPKYAAYGVGYLWFIDPGHKTLEIYRLESSRWFMLGAFGGAEKVRGEPFQEIEIDLGDIWPVDDQAKPE